MYNLLNIADGAFSTTTCNTMITDLIGTVGDILTSGLATVLGLVAVLIGLFFVIRLIKRYIGGNR